MKDDQPSATARMIARSLLLVSKDPARAELVPPESTDINGWFLEACGGNSERFRFLAGQPWFRRLLFQLEQLTAPGLVTHYALRKRQIEEIVRAGLVAGAEQVVVLGAGFDTLALRLHREFPNVAFWELDHPATQRAKRSALAAHEKLGNNLNFAPLDLARGRLKDAVLDKNSALTVFVAEGLLMYLASEQAAGIFQDAHQFSGPGSRFAFTFLEIQPNGCIEFDSQTRFISWWLRRHSEPFRWGLSKSEMTRFLSAQGWHLQETITPLALRRHFLGQVTSSPATGDIVGLAEWLTR